MSELTVHEEVARAERAEKVAAALAKRVAKLEGDVETLHAMNRAFFEILNELQEDARSRALRERWYSHAVAEGQAAIINHAFLAVPNRALDLLHGPPRASHSQSVPK